MYNNLAFGLVPEYLFLLLVWAGFAICIIAVTWTNWRLVKLRRLIDAKKPPPTP